MNDEPNVMVRAKWRPCSTCSGVYVLLMWEHPDNVPFDCQDCARQKGRDEVTR